MGVFLFFTHAHIHFLRSRARAWRGSAAYPRHGMGPCCFPTFTLCSHVVFLHEASSRVSCSMGLAVGYGRGYSSSADPMSVDLAVELGGGQS